MNWYIGRSRELGLKAPRCPFATNERCPHFFDTVSKLATAVPGSRRWDIQREYEFTKYYAHWKDSPLRVPGQQCLTGTIQTDPEAPPDPLEDLPISYHGMCPEVAYEWFGLFVKEIDTRTDITEKGATKLGRGRARPEEIDALLNLDTARPMHYSECPQYSVLLAAPTVPQPAPQPGPQADQPKSRSGRPRTRKLSERDAWLHGFIREREPDAFARRADSQLRKAFRPAANRLVKDFKPWSAEAFRLSLRRIREHYSYPRSADVRKKSGQY